MSKIGSFLGLNWQTLNFEDIDDVFGIGRYVEEWEKIVWRTGRWIDFKNGYKTMDLSFMESVWWVFAQLYEKDLVYKGFKVCIFLNLLILEVSCFL